MPRTKKELDEEDSDNNNEESDDSENELKVNTDNSPKIIPVGKLPDKLKCKKIVLNVSDTQYPIVAEIGEELGWVVEEEEGTGDWDVWWTDREIEANTLYRMNLHQKINHFPGIYVLARKNLLGLHLMAMQKRFPNEYNFFPETWMLPMQFHQFRQYYESVEENKVRTYIVKPEALSQGRGIFLTRNIEELINGRKYVVQKYLKNPLLLDGLKFDLRIYVLLAGTEPLRLYIYEEGLARLATRPYQPPTAENMHENYIHLTNYSLNKSNPEYIFNKSDKEMDTGHKRSLKSVYERLAKNGIDIEKLKNEIEESIIKTVISGLPSIRHQYQYCQPEDYEGNMCFHILGFDVMILDDLKPIVIEVNHTPSFETSTPLDYTIKKNLIKDTLKLMRISAKHKKALFLKSKELTKKRVETGKRDIMKGEERRVHLLQYQKVRDEEEKEILYNAEKPSGYKVIFPFKYEEKNGLYKKYSEAAEEVMRELKDTRKKIISEEKSSSSRNNNKEPSGSIGSGKNVVKLVKNKNNNNGQSIVRREEAISDKFIHERRNSSSLKMVEEINGKELDIVETDKEKIELTQVDNDNSEKHNELRKFSTEHILEEENSISIATTKDNNNAYSPTITRNSFNIRNNGTSTSIKNQEIIINTKINAKPLLIPSSSNETKPNHTKNIHYSELINKLVVNSKDLEQNHEPESESMEQYQEQRISVEEQLLIEEETNSHNNSTFNRRSRNNCEEIMLNVIKKEEIIVPLIKGYKQKVVLSSTLKQNHNNIKNTNNNNKNKNINSSNKQNIPLYNNNNNHKVQMNFINLSAAVKPSSFIVENIFSNNNSSNNEEKQQKQEQKNNPYREEKKYGKFIKPKTYNLNENNFSNLFCEKSNKIVRMGSQGFSIINSNSNNNSNNYNNNNINFNFNINNNFNINFNNNFNGNFNSNKSQTEAIVSENNTNMRNKAHYNNEPNKHESNNHITNEKSSGSRTKVNLLNTHEKKNNYNTPKGSSSLISKPQTGYKNKSNSIISKINSAHFKDNNSLLFKVVQQRQKPNGYE